MFSFCFELYLCIFGVEITEGDEAPITILEPTLKEELREEILLLSGVT